MSEPVNLRHATADDVPGIVALLEPAGLPGVGVAECIEHFYVLEAADGIVAAAGLEPHGRVGLLRSVVVAPSHRGRGLAKRLCDRIAQHARDLEHRSMYLLTMDADDYFSRHGFMRLAREEAPDEIRASREFSELCPDSAILMGIHL